MKIAAFLIALSYTSICVQAHFGVWLFDADGNDGGTPVNVTVGERTRYCLPFEGEVGNHTEWYSYGDPIARSFNNDRPDNRLQNFTTEMANRATLLSTATLGGHDDFTDTSFGFVFGSTDPTSVAGTAQLECRSADWVGLRRPPLQVVDDPEDMATADFNSITGTYNISFEWEAQETDGIMFDHLEDDGEIVCHALAATGLSENIGLIDDVRDGGPWRVSGVPFAAGSRVHWRKSACSPPPATNTTGAIRLEFMRIDGVDSTGTANVYIWYNADSTPKQVRWLLTRSGFTSAITGVYLVVNGQRGAAIGQNEDYVFQLRGVANLTDAQAALVASNQVSLQIATMDNPNGEVATANIELPTGTPDGTTPDGTDGGPDGPGGNEDAGVIATISSVTLLASALLAVLLA